MYMIDKIIYSLRQKKKRKSNRIKYRKFSFYAAVTIECSKKDLSCDTGKKKCNEMLMQEK